MYESTQDALWVHSIDLAQEADFDLGSLCVRPATCEVESNGLSQTLQRRVMQVLVALAQSRGSVVSQSDLVNRCWSGLSVTDDAIYRCISRLRKLAAEYPEPPFAIEAIPGVGYRLTSSDPADARPAGRSARSGFVRRTLLAAAALAILIAGIAIYWTMRGRGSANHLPVRVAVQPFDALSNSDGDRSLARRIPNEIVNELGDSQILIVLGGEQPKGPAAGLVLTGLIRDDGPNVVAAVRMEDGASHAALWSMEFKRDRRQASDLPMEVAARVADEVNMAIFARTASSPLMDNAALSALLQANDLIRDTGADDWATIIDRARTVTTSYPDFAFGHDVLAVGYSVASLDIDVPERARAMNEAARREANLTLKLDPQEAGAYAILSGLEAPDDYRAQERFLLRGIRFAKHPKQPLGALYSYEGTLLSSVGRLREALPYQLVARATDEWGPPKTAKLALNYANMGNYAAAKNWIEKGARLWPNHSGVRWVRQYIAGFYEEPSEAFATFDAIDAQLPSSRKENAVWRSFIEARGSRSPSRTAIAAQGIRDAANQKVISRENEVMMLAGLGHVGSAIQAANSALDHRELQPWILFTPIMGDLRKDPGFLGLASRLGLIKYWRETGKKPDFCTDPRKRGECSPELLAALKSN